TGPLVSREGMDILRSKRTGSAHSPSVSWFISPAGSDLRLGYVLDRDPTVFEGVKYVSHSEEYSVKSIFAGRAAYNEFTAMYCTDNPNVAYDQFDKVRRGAMGPVCTGRKGLCWIV
ncbi:hypothetical protein H0H81_004715, partial [Sphagnurus paluster]